ncbi:MAG: nicotinamide-nucleotide amidohydrolase family protein [Clostridia bacterium]|nr:nicotinamide-nucleotide amidohydrolase family protein [Clostridia bacterium]
MSDVLYIKTVAVPVETVNLAIANLKSACPEISVYLRESYGDLTLEIVKGETENKVFDKAYRETVATLNDYVYALEDVSLTERLVQLLKLRKATVSVAESFTGGGVCKRLVEISGVSEVFFEGLNTYSNKSKVQRLGVKEETLKNHGAVSAETAYEMAYGLMATGNCNLSIATTGIAGPNSDNTKKPVGLIYIAVGNEEHISVYEYNLKGSRQVITETAINIALFLAFKKLK